MLRKKEKNMRIINSIFKNRIVLFISICCFFIVTGQTMFMCNNSDKGRVSFDISGNRVLVIVIDGLRPDYITPQIMP